MKEFARLVKDVNGRGCEVSACVYSGHTRRTGRIFEIRLTSLPEYPIETLGKNGTVIYEAVMTAFGFSELLVSPRGLRDGALRAESELANRESDFSVLISASRPSGVRAGTPGTPPTDQRRL
jgi:hypothetical protein